ncbi:NAD+ synthase [Pelagibacterales bacterium]|nr:NAD+ synthase [Pelagibacterales bacterium]|tara:strand:+ start:19 stop:1671 length:1653 start_codon:yes stop_codon:yes gene_type:complete
MSENLNILLAQTNPIVGNIEHNRDLVLDIVSKNKNADLIVFTELVLSGYPPEDLVLKSAFQNKVCDAFHEIMDASVESESYIIIGRPWKENEQLYNAAIVLHKGKVFHRHLKNTLPNYGVFDEKRIFAAGDESSFFEIKGNKIALFICEEIWDSDTYKKVEGKDCDLVVTINASPFEYQKIIQRENLAIELSKKIDAPVVYVNQVGGQDEIVFDGSSFVADAHKVLRRLPACESATDLVIFDKDKKEFLFSKKIFEEKSEEEILYSNLVLGLRDYIEKNNFPGVVIGISGGIDSAFSACVAVDALGGDKVKGIMMPSKYTSNASVEDATLLGKNLNIEMMSLSIEEAALAYESTLKNVFEGTEQDITEENIQSRIRGMLLMAYSNKFGYMVMTNGNKSEVSVGYSTLYGDMCGGFSVIKDLYKVDVYKLAEWRNDNHPSISLHKKNNVVPVNIISKAPTAELKPNQKDEDSLPPYEILDKILYELVEKESSVTDIVNLGFDEDTVIKVQGLLYNSEYKRRQSAPGVKVSERNFGLDRRYPITNRFRDTKR